MSDALNQVEALNAMRNLAELTSAFRNDLREEGFDDAEAMRLTVAWLTATCRGADHGGDQ